MSEKLQSNSPLSVPLLSEWKLGYSIDEEKVIVSHPSDKNALSFFRTCLNGLNAISGLLLLYYDFDIYIII
jgi:vesicular inhibitory amino acid transporter